MGTRKPTKEIWPGPVKHFRATEAVTTFRRTAYVVGLLTFAAKIEQHR